ncbi:MAG TPA: hypothetical protein VGQ11_02750 [Candidatus Acidoferrales bacterium]|jgi:hypothetical protein|nr:hypothetical protein [Candidatus Acidoferrales bacterium]
MGFVVAFAVGQWLLVRAVNRTERTKKTDRTPLVFVRAWKPLNDDQLREIIGGWNETDPKWKALWDCLSRELESTLADVHSTSSDPHELARWAGRIEELMLWRANLLAWRKLPNLSEAP